MATVMYRCSGDRPQASAVTAEMQSSELMRKVTSTCSSMATLLPECGTLIDGSMSIDCSMSGTFERGCQSRDCTRVCIEGGGLCGHGQQRVQHVEVLVVREEDARRLDVALHRLFELERVLGRDHTVPPRHAKSNASEWCQSKHMARRCPKVMELP